jgi:hypothetical protein
MSSLRLSISGLCALTFTLATAGIVACSPADSTTGDGDGDGDGDGTATGGTVGDGDGDSTNELPSDMTEAGIAAFLDAQTYRSAPWVGDAAIRGSESVGNIHGSELRVFFNSAAVAAKMNGSSEIGTMVVKELYESGAMVGQAVTIKTGEGVSMNSWTFYCSAPEDSSICSGSSSSGSHFGTGLIECGFCHGETPIAPLPQ